MELAQGCSVFKTLKLFVSQRLMDWPAVFLIKVACDVQCQNHNTVIHLVHEMGK